MLTPHRAMLLVVLLFQCTGCSAIRHSYNKMFGKEVSNSSCSEIGCGLDGTCAAPGVMEGQGGCQCDHCEHHGQPVHRSTGYTQAIQKYRTQKHVGHRGKVADCPHMKYRRKLGQSLVKRPRGVNRSMKHTYGSEIYDLPYPELASGELFPGDEGMREDFCPICNVSYCPDCLGIDDDYYYGGMEEGINYADGSMLDGQYMNDSQMMQEGEMMDGQYMEGQYMDGQTMDGQMMPGMQYQQNEMPGNINLPLPGEVYTPGNQGNPGIPDDGKWQTSPDATTVPGNMPNSVPSNTPGGMNMFPQGNPGSPSLMQPLRMNPVTPGLPPATAPKGIDTMPNPDPAPAPNISATTTWRSGASFPAPTQQMIPASYLSNQSSVSPPELLIK